MAEQAKRQRKMAAPIPDSKAPEAGAPATGAKAPGGKLGLVIALLRRPQGAGIAELMAHTGWQAHSVRGAMSGAVKKKLGLNVTSVKTEDGRVYRIVEAEG